MFLKKLFIKKYIYGVLFFVLLLSLFFGGAKKVEALAGNPNAQCCIIWLTQGQVSDPLYLPTIKEQKKTMGCFAQTSDYCRRYRSGNWSKEACDSNDILWTKMNESGIGQYVFQILDPDGQWIKDVPEGTWIPSFGMGDWVARNTGGKQFCESIKSFSMYVEQNVRCANPEYVNLCAKNRTVILSVLGDDADCENHNQKDCVGRGAPYCFWPAAFITKDSPGTCVNRVDMTKCQYYKKDDCDQVKQDICNWVPEAGKCLDRYQQWLYKAYDYSKKDFGTILPECAKLGACTNVNELVSVFVKFAKEVFKYVGALAFLFFIYGGGVMVLSFGNAEKFKKGRQILLAAVIGMVIVFSAYFAVGFLLELLGAGSVNIFT